MQRLPLLCTAGLVCVLVCSLGPCELLGVDMRISWLAYYHQLLSRVVSSRLTDSHDTNDGGSVIIEGPSGGLQYKDKRKARLSLSQCSQNALSVFAHGAGKA